MNYSLLNYSGLQLRLPSPGTLFVVGGWVGWGCWGAHRCPQAGGALGDHLYYLETALHGTVILELRPCSWQYCDHSWSLPWFQEMLGSRVASQGWPRMIWLFGDEIMGERERELFSWTEIVQLVHCSGWFVVMPCPMGLLSTAVTLVDRVHGIVGILSFWMRLLWIRLTAAPESTSAET